MLQQQAILVAARSSRCIRLTMMRLILCWHSLSLSRWRLQVRLRTALVSVYALRLFSSGLRQRQSAALVRFWLLSACSKLAPHGCSCRFCLPLA